MGFCAEYTQLSEPQRGLLRKLVEMLRDAESGGGSVTIPLEGMAQASSVDRVDLPVGGGCECEGLRI